MNIAVYDVVGRLVRTPVNEEKSAGDHRTKWDGRDYSGNEVVSGVYFARLTFGRQAISRKLVLLK